MPIGLWSDFNSCVLAQKEKGHSEDSAKRICGAIEAKINKNSEPEGLTEIEKKEYDEAVKLQDSRAPKEWFDSCLAKNGDKANPASYCGFLWSTVVQGQGADPQEVLKKSEDYAEMFNKTNQFLKTFAETQTLENEEIFAVGKWNGDTYTHDDLVHIAENFNKLKDEVKPPVKLGHSENQKLLEADDMPAGGWVKSLKVAWDKLLADISDVPKKIYELIKNKAYKRKSAEIYPEYTGSDGKKYGKVLRALAFLGAACPAVNTLDDIHALYKDKQNQMFKMYVTEGGERTVKTLNMAVSNSEDFTADFQTKFAEAMKTAFGNGISVKFEGEGGGDAETIKGLKDKIAELEKELEDQDMEDMKAKYDETVKVLNETKTKLADAETKAGKLAETETKLTEAQTQLQTQAVATHKAEVKAFTEKAKAEGKIIPANEPLVTALLEQMDGKTVIKFTEKDKDGNDVQVNKSPFELIKKFVESLPKLVEFAEVSGDKKDILTFKADGEGEITHKGERFKVDDLELAAKARKYSADNNVTLEVAMIEVSKG